MTSLVSALDNYTPSQYGEKGSVEYGWSNDIRERIVQLSFQLTRTRDDTALQTLTNKTRELLIDISLDYNIGKLDRAMYLDLMSILFRMVGHTRDIIGGKGEYKLAYMLLVVWYPIQPKLAEFAFKHFLVPPQGKEDLHPYGCWKDIKYLHEFAKESELVNYGIRLLVEQLRKDEHAENPSLAAKWVPRQKSKFGALFTQIAVEYYPEYFQTAKSANAKERALLKAKTMFRQLVSGLNKKLDTVQIKQCSGHWAEIEPEKQTSITMHKQKKAFLNIDKKGEQRSELEDRILCAEKFKEFANKASKGDVTVKGKRIGLNDFTNEALKLLTTKVVDEIHILNAQWRDNSTQTGALGKMIAMVDVSGSMMGDPLHAAIALGIRIAEKSMLGKRVLTFSASPSWVNLHGYDNFVDMVAVLQRAEWGMNTNFYSALKMILDSIILARLKPEDVEDMVLTILSDMQMDQADHQYTSLMDSIERLYADAGIQVWGNPYKAPHILFWNLRSTSGFPTLSSHKNCSMMSGFSPALLNVFCEEGIDALQSCTPWSLLEKSLENERYDILDRFARDNL